MRDRLPGISVDLEKFRAGEIFPAELPLWLEIGFGGGEHILARARENPDVGLIGCEPFLNGIATLVLTLEADRLQNVRIWPDDALVLLDAAPPNAFDRIYLLYPDPWPKRRHNKRRFVNDATVAVLAKVLKSGGQVRFATDIDDYAGWTLSRFLASPDFKWNVAEADDWRQPWSGWQSTRYERKARKARRASAYLTFQRC